MFEKDQITYLRLSLVDDETEQIVDSIETAISFLGNAKKIVQ